MPRNNIRPTGAVIERGATLFGACSGTITTPKRVNMNLNMIDNSFNIRHMDVPIDIGVQMRVEKVFFSP